MEVDDEFLLNFIRLADAAITMTRDKLVWQNLAIPCLGENWKERFEEARGNPKFLGEHELYLAELNKMRDQGVQMLDQLRKGIPVRPPNAQPN